MSFHRPSTRNECLALPPVFHNSLREPRLIQLGVIGDDDLHLAFQLGHSLVNPAEKPDHPVSIRVAEYVERSFGILVRGVVNLRWLIEDQKARYWPMMLDEPLVDGKVDGQMTPEPILSASHLLHRHWPAFCVRDER